MQTWRQGRCTAIVSVSWMEGRSKRRRIVYTTVQCTPTNRGCFIPISSLNDQSASDKPRLCCFFQAWILKQWRGLLLLRRRLALRPCDWKIPCLLLVRAARDCSRTFLQRYTDCFIFPLSSFVYLHQCVTYPCLGIIRILEYITETEI